MDLNVTQQLLARLFTDEHLRQRFFTEPASVCTEFNLAADDVDQLAQLSQSEVAGFARSLQRKRLGELRHTLPDTCRLLGSRLDELFTRHATQFQPHGLHKHIEDALTFAAFLEGIPGLPVEIIDLARYQANWLRFHQGRRHPSLMLIHCDPRKLGEGDQLQRRRMLACWFRFAGRIRHFLVAC